MLTNVIHSPTFKVFGIALLALLMLIPLGEVQGLIGERSAMRATAVNAIAEGWGGAQKLGGAVLAVPHAIRVQTANGWTTQEVVEILLPDELTVDAVMQTEERHYGIYNTPVYTAAIKVSGRFRPEDLAGLPDADSYLWQRAELRIPIFDVHGIRRISSMNIDGGDHAFTPSENGVAGIGAVAVAFDMSSGVRDAHAFRFDMTLAGTESLHVAPMARRTSVHITAPWPHPTFNGMFLPATRRVDTSGFDATWQVLDLNRRFGQHWREGSERQGDVNAAAFGVALYQPAGTYQQNDRAGKYGLLFIALTFVVFFLFEVLKKLRVHPVQYLLVGLALATFYVVLLALSEQTGFTAAYAAAALSVVLIVSSYAAAILHAWRAGAVLGATMTLVYVLLYGLIVSEQHSLLMGAIALLVTVATLMHLTRKVDWYSATAAVAPAFAPK
ncbi:MAG TPA: cell envelope integrity protein CreD [Rudaea sp.]|nr:cell envelope integrity protein CreD [Rudaea sp.]